VDGLSVSFGENFYESGRDFFNFCSRGPFGSALLSLARKLLKLKNHAHDEQPKDGL
jgi:hypothetical protein